jgi:hypothetical protein
VLVDHAARAAIAARVGLPARGVVVAFEEPFGVGALDELVDGGAQVGDVAVVAAPDALFLEGADEPLGAAVAGRLAGKAGESLMPSQRSDPWKCPEVYWGPQSWRQATPRAASGPSTQK